MPTIIYLSIIPVSSPSSPTSSLIPRHFPYPYSYIIEKR